MVVRAPHAGTRRILLLALALGLAGCSSGPATSSTTPTATAGEPVIHPCSTFEIRSPAGAIVDLTGSWLSEHELIYYAFQAGDCLWLSGGFETSTTDDVWRFGGLGPWTTSFRGQLTAEFTVVGDWADVRTAELLGFNRGWGTATYEIEFTGSGSEEGMTLFAISFTGHLEDRVFTFLGPQDIPPP